MEDIIYRGGNYVFFVSGVAPQLLLRINNVENLYTQLLISVVSSVISIFLYVVIYAMPLKVDEFLLKTYPKQYVNTL